MGILYTYCITNLVNGKKYYGKTSANPPEKRWQQHLTATRKGPDDHHRFQYLHRAIRKHGVQNFKFELVGMYDNEAECSQAEIDLIAEHQTTDRSKGYNLTIGGDGALGYRFSRAQRRRMSERRKGKYLGDKNPFYGKRHSARVRKLLSEKAAKRTGRRNHFYGKHHSEEARRLIGLNAGRKHCYLAVEQVEEARRLYATSEYTYAQLAEKFDVTPYVAEKAICGLGAYAKVGRQLPRRENGWIKAQRPSRRVLTDEDVAVLRRRYRKGEDLTTLANERGVSTTLISHAVRGHTPYDRVQCDEPPIPSPEISRPLPDEKVDEARQLYATGKFTYEQLAEKFGVSKAVVQNAIRGEGRYSEIGTPLRAKFGKWRKNERRAANER